MERLRDQVQLARVLLQGGQHLLHGVQLRPGVALGGEEERGGPQPLRVLDRGEQVGIAFLDRVAQEAVTVDVQSEQVRRSEPGAPQEGHDRVLLVGPQGRLQVHDTCQHDQQSDPVVLGEPLQGNAACHGRRDHHDRARRPRAVRIVEDRAEVLAHA